MVKKRLGMLLLGVMLMISAVLMVPSRSFAVHAESMGFNYYDDMTVKVANLPKNNPNTLYVLNSVDDTVVEMPLFLPFARSMMSKGYVPFITLFSSYAGLYADLWNHLAGCSTADDLASRLSSAKILDATQTSGTAELYYKLGKQGKTFYDASLAPTFSFMLYVDIVRAGRIFVDSYTNLYVHTDLKIGGKQVLFHNSKLYTTVNMAGDPQSWAFENGTPYIYLAYDLPRYSVSFEYLDIGGEWTSETSVYTLGATISDVPEVPAAPYATFRGWNQALTPVNASVVYRATYQYEQFRAVFKNRDGTIYQTKALTHYENFPMLSLPSYTATEGTKENTYAFIGWSTVQNDISMKVDSSYRLTGDIMLYPLYRLSKSVDLETGKTEHFDEGNIGLIGSIINFFDSVKNIPVVGGLLYWVLIIVAIVLAVPLLVLIVRGLIWVVKSIVNWVRGLAAKRKYRN